MGEGDTMFAPQLEIEISGFAGELAATDWWSAARCNDGAGTMSGLFFSEELQDIARAKQICAVCPVIADCLEGALERREPWGVWGGQLFLNGKVLASKRPVWLLDEPFAALDASGQTQVAQLMARHCGEGGIIIAATHDPLGLGNESLKL